MSLPTMLAALTAAGFGPAGGVSIPTPPGWFAWTPRARTTGVTNPVLRRELVAPSGTVIQIRELVPPLLTRGSVATLPARPRHFDVASFRRTAGCVLPGAVGTWFRESGRAFYVVVQHPRPLVGTILDGLRIGRGTAKELGRIVAVGSEGRSVVRLARPAVRPAACIAFTATWGGPAARSRPTRICLGRKGVFARGRLHPLEPGVWNIAALNRR